MSLSSFHLPFNGLVANLDRTPLEHLRDYVAFVQDPWRAAAADPPDIEQLARTAALLSDTRKLFITEQRAVIEHYVLEDPSLRAAHEPVKVFLDTVAALPRLRPQLIKIRGTPHANLYPPDTGQKLHGHGTGGQYKFPRGAGHPGMQDELLRGWHTVEVGMRVSASDTSAFALQLGLGGAIFLVHLPNYSWWVLSRTGAGECEVLSLANPADKVGRHSGVARHGVPSEDTWRATLMHFHVLVKALSEKEAVALVAKALEEAIRAVRGWLVWWVGGGSRPACMLAPARGPRHITEYVWPICCFFCLVRPPWSYRTLLLRGSQPQTRWCGGEGERG